LILVRGSAALATLAHVGRFVRDHLVDGETAGSGFQRQCPAGRQPEKKCRSARCLDERGNVLDLARRRIRGRVTALATPATVVRVDGEMRRKQCRELPGRAEAAAAECAIHEKQRRTRAGSLERDRGSIFRPDVTHDCLRSRQGRNARSRASRSPLRRSGIYTTLNSPLGRKFLPTPSIQIGGPVEN
jgi:hypothetical protein